MKLYIHKTILIGILVLIFSGISSAEDFDVGEVIEVAPNYRFIQVRDRTYKISEVWTMESENMPIAASPQDISEGLLVKVVKGARKSYFWLADSVTIYQGEMERKLREEMELPATDNAAISTQLKDKPVSKQQPVPTEIKLEDGVFKN